MRSYLCGIISYFFSSKGQLTNYYLDVDLAKVSVDSNSTRKRRNVTVQFVVVERDAKKLFRFTVEYCLASLYRLSCSELFSWPT